jgi:hypothetical protein
MLGLFGVPQNSINSCKLICLQWTKVQLCCRNSSVHFLQFLYLLSCSSYDSLPITAGTHFLEAVTFVTSNTFLMKRYDMCREGCSYMQTFGWTKKLIAPHSVKVILIEIGKCITNNFKRGVQYNDSASVPVQQPLWNIMKDTQQLAVIRE